MAFLSYFPALVVGPKHSAAALKFALIRHTNADIPVGIYATKPVTFHTVTVMRTTTSPPVHKRLLFCGF